MLSVLADRLRRVRIRQSVELVAPGIYTTCPHWWSWWMPNTAPVWQFADDAGNTHDCAITYGTMPVVITTSGTIVGGIWFGAPPTYIVYGQELDTRSREADIPTLFLLYEHRGEIDRLAFPGATTTAALIVPQSAKWSAELSASMHNGMLEAIRDIMRRALVDVLDATWIPMYNPSIANTGSGLPGEANTLFLTLRWRKYD